MNDSDDIQISVNNQIISFSNDNLINITNIGKENPNSDSYINIILDNSLDNNSLNNSKKDIINLELNNKDINLYKDISFISMNSKNIFTKENKNYIDDINQKFKKIYYQDSKSFLKLNDFTNSIKDNLLEHLFPKIEQDFFQISLDIAKKMKKQNLLKKEKLEKNIEYFFVNRVYFKYSECLTIDKKFINNCGPLLCQIFRSLDNYKIKDYISLKNAIKEIRNKNIDVLKDYFFYCNNNDLKPEYCKKHKYFKSVKKKYSLKPELILILNMLHLVTKIIINFDFDGEIFEQNELYFFYIVIFNIYYLVKDIKNIKLNLINRNFQFAIIGIYNQKLMAEKKPYFKKNRILFDRYIYNEKWDFENDFALEYHKSLKTENEFYYKNMELPNLDDLKNGLDILKNKNTLNKSKYPKKSENIIINDFIILESDKNQELKRRNTINYSKNLLTNKNDKKEIEDINDKEDSKIIKDYFTDIVQVCSYSLENILITFICLNNFETLEKVELIIDESYNYEYISYFKNVGKINIENSHLIDFAYNKLINLSFLSFEINFFDLSTVNRIFKLLYNNVYLISLKFSFFSSDSTYFPQNIYKINNRNLKNKLVKKNKKDINNNLNFKIEDTFFTNFYPYFERNLNYFFEIIKKKNLKTLGLNLEMPSQLVNNEKYIIIIFKFIINILLLYFDNNESTVEELIILSSNLVINGNKLIFFDKFLENINKNNSLISLKMNMKFYNIININKLIGNKLKIINIGDLDLFSLNHLIENIDKYNICENSLLEQISISLNKTIIKLEDEVKLLIAKLFYLKIKNLSSISIYTNIEIKSKEEFEEIIKIINNNWISSYLIIFNDKSNNIINNNSKLYKNANLNYITKKIKKSTNNKININIDVSDEIFFCLKTVFNKSLGIILDFYSNKKIISKILNYLYVSKELTLNFSLPNDDNIII